MQKNNAIKAVQLNPIIEYRKIPNDPDFRNQWQYRNTGEFGTFGVDLDMDDAWDVTTGGLTPRGDTIVVCIIDNGLDVRHGDLATMYGLIMTKFLIMIWTTTEMVLKMII